MAKSQNQKLKLLYIVQLLRERSDEEHPISTNQIIAYLSQNEIQAERKSIYTDIEALKEFGYDIEYKKSRSDGGYYLISREFEIPELRLLVDLVQSAKFLTQKKSEEMIRKLEQFASQHQARTLNRQVYVAKRIKSENESIYYVVDEIHRAIALGKSITFGYVYTDVDKKEQFRKNGERYHVSPWALTWNDECYYLIGYDHASEAIRHYRVDRMRKTSVDEMARIGQDAFEHFDLPAYCNKTFHMFAGPEIPVVLKVKNQMADIVFDRFGKDIQVHKQADGYFTTMVHVMVSAQFFGWLASLSDGCNIVSPIDVRNQYMEYLQSIFTSYMETNESQT